MVLMDVAAHLNVVADDIRIVTLRYKGCWGDVTANLLPQAEGREAHKIEIDGLSRDGRRYILMRKLHYWGGCTFRARYPDDIKAHIELLEMLGYDVKSIDDEGCCGYPLLLAGELPAARTIAERTVTGLHDVELLTTECPGCYRVFRDEYPKMGFAAPRVHHLTQIIARHLERLIVPTKETVSYHDPCDLGRLGGDYQSARKVLNRIADIVEPLATKELANCCGAGGLLLTVAPELSMRIGEVRLEDDFEPMGVDKLITACPSCLFNLAAAAERRGSVGKGIRVLDLATYVFGRLKGNG